MSSFSDVAVPESIPCADQIFDLSFHPGGEYLACGLIDGAVEVWKYGLEESTRMLSVAAHGGSCRGVEFSSDGNNLFTVSADCHFRGLDANGGEVFKIKAHRTPINKLATLDASIFATGDDAGEVKIWDVRTGGQDAVMEWHVHEDFISGFAYSPERNALLSVSGDATLVAYDLRKGGGGVDAKQNAFRSEDQEAEMHCVTIFKHGKKVVCGTTDGVMLVFTWDRWADCSDRYPGHPETVDCMLKIDESTVLTGSSDGLIRAVSIQPNKMIGVLGDHEDFPVEGMRASPDGMLLASFAHDNLIRWNDISMFVGDEDDTADMDDEGDGALEGEQAGAKVGGKVGGGAKARKGEESSKDAEGEEEEEDEEEEEEDDDEMDDESSEFDSESSDDEKSGARGAGGSGYKIKTAAEKFYADL
jgi:WD40 repeat protein